MAPRERTLRVALVVPALGEGGGVSAVARFLYGLLERSDRYAPYLVSLATSARDEASVRLADPSSWFEGPRVREETWQGRPFVHVGARLVELEFMRYMPRRPIVELLKDADLVQVVAGSPSWVLAVQGSQSPVFLQVATVAERERERRHRVERGAAGLWRRAMTRVTSRLDRIGLRKADRIFVENAWMERQAATIAGSERVLFAPPGVDVERFTPVEGDHAAGTGEEDYILSVARFGDPRKNPELLFRAYADVARRLSNPPELRLVGPSPPSEAAWRVAEQCGVRARIHYQGEVTDEELARLYRQALVFILSSVEEGFGLVVVEAMASGVPVVATKCGGPDDIITDGQDGYLVPVSDARALADAMERVVTDPDLRRRMGRSARRTTVDRYSVDVTGERFLSAYDAALEGIRNGRGNQEWGASMGSGCRSNP